LVSVWPCLPDDLHAVCHSPASPTSQITSSAASCSYRQLLRTLFGSTPTADRRASIAKQRLSVLQPLCTPRNQALLHACPLNCCAVAASQADEDPLAEGLEDDADNRLWVRMMESLNIKADEDDTYATIFAPTDRVSAPSSTHAWQLAAAACDCCNITCPAGR
jgi:hypothetical protein